MSSSDRQFQHIPRYKHFAKVPFYQAPSDIERHSLLCFYYLTNVTYSYRVTRCYGSSLSPMIPVRILYGDAEPSLPHSRSAFSYCLAVCWKPNINVHILPKDNPVIWFIRSYNTPVAIRLSSRIGFCKSRYWRLRELFVRMVHEMNCHISPQYMTRSY